MISILIINKCILIVLSIRTFNIRLTFFLFLEVGFKLQILTWKFWNIKKV